MDGEGTRVSRSVSADPVSSAPWGAYAEDTLCCGITRPEDPARTSAGTVSPAGLGVGLSTDPKKIWYIQHIYIFL